jgi:sugar lactone lactonase YvrE
MVVDSRGRAYVGNFGFDRHRGEPPRAAALARVDPDGAVTRAAEDLEFPNGTVITPDGRTLVVAETLGQRLTAFDVAADGALTKRRVWAKLDGVFPDGICLDAEGAIWVSDARGPDLLRVREGGAIERRIPTGPGRHAFACMLGGADRRTLYVCTCTGSGPAMADKCDGRIETVRVDVPGAGLP